MEKGWRGSLKGLKGNRKELDKRDKKGLAVKGDGRGTGKGVGKGV